jgi:hypothetical protein
VARKYSLNCGYWVELRGLEPLALPAETGSELQRMFVDVVTRSLRVQRIFVAVLRDVTVLATGLCKVAEL